MNNIDAKEAQKYEEDYGEPWPDEEDRECNHVECDECGAYRNTDLDDFAGFCVFKGVIRTWYCQDCWEVHADTCRNPECPYARCGHCQVCMSYCEELEEKWLEIESECDAEWRTMNRTLLEKFPMCCECERRICKGCRVKDDLICQACHKKKDESEDENEGDEDVLYQSYKCNGCNYTTSDDDPDCVKCKKTGCMIAQI